MVVLFFICNFIFQNYSLITIITRSAVINIQSMEIRKTSCGIFTSEKVFCSENERKILHRIINPTNSLVLHQSFKKIKYTQIIKEFS